MSLSNLTEKPLLGVTYVTTEPCYNIAKSFTLFYTIVGIAGVLHFILLPIYLQIRELPLNCWYPFNTNVSLEFPYNTRKRKNHFPFQPKPIFEILYLSQCLGQIQVGYAFTNAGVTIASIVWHIIGQFDILFCSLKNVRYTAMMLNGLTQNRAELK